MFLSDSNAHCKPPPSSKSATFPRSGSFDQPYISNWRTPESSFFRKGLVVAGGIGRDVSGEEVGYVDIVSIRAFRWLKVIGGYLVGFQVFLEHGGFGRDAYYPQHLP